MPQQSHMETAGGSQATSKRAASRKRKYDPKSQGNNSKNRNRRREKRQKRLNQTNPPSDSDVVEITALPPKEHVSSGRDVIAGTRRSGSATSAAPSASSGTRRFALMQSIMKDCSPATQKKFESTSSSTIKPSALNQVVIEDGTPEAAEEQHHLTIQYTRGKSVPAHSIEPELKSERESKVKGSQKRNNASFAIEIPPVRKNTLDSAWASGTVAGHRNGTTPIEVTSEDGSWYEAKTTIARANAAKLKSDDSVLPTIEEERSFRARSPTIHRFSSFGISPTPSAHGRLAPNEVDRKEQIATFEWEYDPGKVRGRVRSKLDNEDAEVEESAFLLCIFDFSQTFQSHMLTSMNRYCLLFPVHP